MSRGEPIGGFVRLVGEIEGVIEKESPAADDLACLATALALDPLAPPGHADARDPERQHRREVKRRRCGVREAHNSLVAAPSRLMQAIDVRCERTLAQRAELAWVGIEPD